MPSTRSALVLVALVLLLVTLPGSRGTYALFSDRAPVNTAAFAAGTVAPVASVQCTGTGTGGTTLSWPGQTSRDYVVQFVSMQNLSVQPHTTTATSFLVNRTTTRLTPGDWQVIVRARVPGSDWRSSSQPLRFINVTSTYSYSCF